MVGVHWEAPLGKREITIPTFESPSQVPENQAQRTSLFLSWRREIGRMSLATWLGPLRRFVLAHPWDVDVEGVGFCWSVARRA